MRGLSIDLYFIYIYSLLEEVTFSSLDLPTSSISQHDTMGVGFSLYLSYFLYFIVFLCVCVCFFVFPRLFSLMIINARNTHRILRIATEIRFN